MKRKDERDRSASTEPTEEAAFGLPRPGRALAALTGSALALPGIAGSAGADTPVERSSLASSFSYYREDNLSPSRFANQGSRDRMEVFTTQFRADVPLTKRTDLGIDFLYESMSGASPWFVVPGSTPNERLQVMSGATIDDDRYDLMMDVDFFLDNGKDTLAAGFSIEDDYTSFNFSIGGERNFNDKNTTLSLSGGSSFDWLEPTDANLFQNRPDDEFKWSLDLFAGLSQILTRSSTMMVTINYKHSDGYLSDPYKEVAQISGGNLSDERPGNKDQISLMVRYRHHIEPVAASVHADYRFYYDDYDIYSHTAELAWYQSIFEWLRIIPSVRYYSQSKADFYEPVLPAPRSERSSDFRLSPYGAVSGRIKAEVEFEDVFQYRPPTWLEFLGVTEGLDLIASLSWERYWSDGDFGLTDVKESDEAPGLVRFHVFAASLTGRF